MSMNLELGSNSVLGKRKCESEFAEPICGEKEEEKEKEKGGEVRRSCEICSEDDHSHRCCPFKVFVPPEIVPSLGPSWIVMCKYCGKTDDELKTFASRASCFRRVFLNLCPFCFEFGHRNKECLDNTLDGSIDSPFIPPSGLAPPALTS